MCIVAIRTALMCVIVSVMMLVWSAVSSYAASGNGMQKDSTQVQAAESLRFGLWGAYSLHQHTVDISEFRTTPLFFPRTSRFPGPPNLRFESGSGISLGALVDVPFSRNAALSLRLSYVQHNAFLTTQEPVLLGDANGTVSENIIEYRINAAPATLGADLFFKYTLLTSSSFGGLYVLAGARGGFLLHRVYSQEERLLTPTRGGFTPSGDPFGNRQSGDIPDAQAFQLWASAGLGYDVPLQFPFGTILVSPEISYAYALTNILQSSSVPQGSGLTGSSTWSPHFLRGGVAFTLPLASPAKNLDTELQNTRQRDSLARIAFVNDSVNAERIAAQTLDSARRATRITAAPTQKIEKKISVFAQQSLLKAESLKNTRQIDIKPVSIVRFVKRVNGRDVSDEQENEKLIIPIQELLVRDELPLLPYIFFDGESSTKIPDRYSKLSASGAETFSPESFKASSNLAPKQHPYYSLLDIIGYRMKRLPLTQVNILGCTDGFTSEKNRPRLGEVRANVVADYLKTVWGIDSTRLVVSELRGTNVSTKASRPLHETDKQAENRRVELSSDTTALFAPLLLTDTITHTLTPIMRFYLIVPPTLSVKSWRIKIRQGRQNIKEFRGTGKPPLAIDWRVDAKEMEKINDKLGEKNVDANSVESTFDILEADGSGVSSPVEKIETQERRFRVNADERVENALVERQSLILFDGGKSTLTHEHIETLKGVNARMTSNSKLLFEGYMDKSGDEEFNERLSLARAQAAAQALRFNVRGAQVEIKGYGGSKTLYDTRLPEGRIYSRTVRITQETPIHE